MEYKFCPFIKDECNHDCIFFNQTIEINKYCSLYNAVKNVNDHISNINSIETDTGNLDYMNTTLNSIEKILKDQSCSDD